MSLPYSPERGRDVVPLLESSDEFGSPLLTPDEIASSKDDSFKLGGANTDAARQTGSGTLSSILTFSQSFVSIGCFVMPYNIAHMGIFTGFATFTLLTLVSLFTFSLQARSIKILRKHYNIEAVCMTDIAHGAFGSLGSSISDLCLALLLSASGASFVITTMELCGPIVYGCMQWNEWWNMVTLGSVVVLLTYPLCCLRRLDALALPNALTVVCFAYAFLAMCYKLYYNRVVKSMTPPITPWMYVCLTMFQAAAMMNMMMIRHFTVPQIYAEMRNKGAIGRVLGGSMVVMWVTFGLFGIVGYMAEGMYVPSNVLSAYPCHDIPIGIARVLVAAALIVKMPLFIQPLRKVVNRYCLGHDTPKAWFLALETAGILLLCLGISLTLQSLKNVLTFFGGTVGPVVSFILPCACFLKLDHASSMGKGGSSCYTMARSAIVGVIPGLVMIMGALIGLGDLYVVFSKWEGAGSHR